MKKRKIKRKVKILLIVIFITFLIICLTNSNNKGQVIEVEQINKYKYILVNKENKLNKDFKPNNLVEVKKCSEGNFYLEEETAEAYQQMCLNSIKAGLNIRISSAYRSYKEQIKLYNEYLKLYGKDYVDKYVAVAGYSEHQTGLAIDLKSLDYENFKNSKEYLWIKENSHNYGFIIRYPDGKEKITGYSAEEWHIRYVGKEVAKYIYENDITFEEYYNLFLK
ncbi:MAG: D-alanyl-D-alanine carboxypeptidase family protein [Firmicutes bacterium]|nr:D-alanyl-D-alanine carboxypeptidase family protein [Bacillota bacterium]